MTKQDGECATIWENEPICDCFLWLNFPFHSSNSIFVCKQLTAELKVIVVTNEPCALRMVFSSLLNHLIGQKHKRWTKTQEGSDRPSVKMSLKISVGSIIAQSNRSRGRGTTNLCPNLTLCVCQRSFRLGTTSEDIKANGSSWFQTFPAKQTLQKDDCVKMWQTEDGHFPPKLVSVGWEQRTEDTVTETPYFFSPSLSLLGTLISFFHRQNTSTNAGSALLCACLIPSVYYLPCSCASNFR